eukprot:2632389-Amphidinium_carterae.2
MFLCTQPTSTTLRLYNATFCQHCRALSSICAIPRKQDLGNVRMMQRSVFVLAIGSEIPAVVQQLAVSMLPARALSQQFQKTRSAQLCQRASVVRETGPEPDFGQSSRDTFDLVALLGMD